MPTPCTVSGNLQTLTAGAVAQGQIIFQLTNIGTGNAVGITGTSLFPSLRYVVMSAPDGSFSCQVWGNDNITPINTFYAVTFRDAQGNEVGPIQYNITGASVNLNTLPGGGSMAGLKFQQFTSSGAFTIPAATVKVTIVGGGGAGGGGTTVANNPGSGGGAGGALIKWLSALTPGNTLTVAIGSGGTGVSGGTGNGGSGSQVSSGTQSITTLTAQGGLGGGTNALGGTGGGASNGDLNFMGSSGPTSIPINNGSPGTASIFGGAPAGSANGATGTTATVPGAGGGGGGSGGGANTVGGAGANGIVIFEWIG